VKSGSSLHQLEDVVRERDRLYDVLVALAVPRARDELHRPGALSAGTSRDVGDILGNEREPLHAFAMVREAFAWLHRTLPQSARFPNGAINREDRLPAPAEALRC
jgi:hypothetical protein